MKRFNFKILITLFLACALVSDCSLRKKDDDQASEDRSPDGESRPDSKGIPTPGSKSAPNSQSNWQKGRYDLGAVFTNANYWENSTSRFLLTPTYPSPSPSSTPIKLARLTEHECRFMDFSSKKIFHWTSRSQESRYQDQSLDVDLSLKRLPAQGESFTIKGFFSSLGSVSLRVVQKDSLAFGSWSTSTQANEDKGSCSLEIVHSVDENGHKITSGSEVKGRFRVEGLLKCSLANFFDSDKTKMLQFEAELGCIGDAGGFF